MAEMAGRCKSQAPGGGATSRQVYRRAPRADLGTMVWPILERLRGAARGVAAILVVAMLLPLAATALPAAAVSGETGLDRDIATNICSPIKTGTGSGKSRDPGSCCILCAAGFPPIVRSPSASGFDLLPPRRIGAAFKVVPGEAGRPWQLDDRQHAPRGPPAA